MNHLTADELIDAVEGVLDAGRQAHLDTCDPCRRELAGLSSVLRETRAVDLPEPSPLFWQHFSERVRTAIDADPLPATGWAGWRRWPVMGPLAAATLLVMALLLRTPARVDPTVSERAANEAAVSRVAADDVALADDRWVLVADIVGEMDWDIAGAAGLVVEPGDAERAVLEMTTDEQRELTRLLRAELQRAKS